MTRKKDSFWEYAERLNGRRFKCNFCGRDFAGGIPRVKSHLSGIRGRDIDICTEVPRDVQLAAAATIKAIRKRPKTEAFSSNSDENSFEACEKNDSRLPDSLLAKFFLLNNIDYGVVKSPSFIDFVNAVVTFGPAYSLPSYSTLENVTIPSLLGEVKEHVSNVKESWGETGCTLISDIWCDEKENMSFINIVACSLKGAVLLDTLEIPKHKLTSEFLVVIINFLIQKVGADNVVQYINGAHGMVPSGSLLADRYPHMYVTQCVAAEIQSLFEEVYSKIEWVQAAFDNARCLVSHIYGDSNLLSLARQYTNDKELRQPQLREFSSNYDMLLSIVDARSELLQLVQSPEWFSFGYDTQELGKEVTEIIHSSEFWNRVQEVVMALESLCIVLYTVDKYGSSSGYLYWVMEIATEKIRRIYDVNPTKYQWIWEIFNSRKGRIVHPIHIAAAFLNPACMCTKMFRDKIKVIEVMNFVVRQLVADEDKEAFVEQMMVYHSREPALFSDIPNIMMKTFHPCKWWDYCGHKLPVLRKYAIRILSQPCSTLVCKQSLTAFNGAQMKQQQRFALETPYSHLSLRMNMILTANFIARDTSNKPIDLTDLDRLKLIDRSFSNDLLNGAGVPRLHLQPCCRSPFSSEQYPDQKELQLQFVTGISYFQVTGQEVKGEHGSPIHVFMVDLMTGNVVQDDTLSMLWLTVSALQGDFDEEARNDWTREDFEENEIMDVPLMSGELQLTLKKGMGTLGAVTFNYDSSITRSGKFRIGVKTATGHNEGIRIREGISSAFVVEYAKVSGRHDAAANHTCLPDDSQPTSDMDEMAWPWSPLQNVVDGETVFYDQFFESMWNAEVINKHKQKVSIKSRQAAIRWLKLKAILQWAILRKLVARKRTQRMIIWTLVHKRLQKWSKGSRWTIEEHERFLSGLQGQGKLDWTYISEKYVISKTPAQVESHAKKYFDYRSRIGIDEEKKHMLVQPEHLFKEEQELINPTDLSVEDPARFPRPVVSQQSHSLTLFPSLLCEHGAEANDNEVSEIFIQKGGDKKVLNQSEPTKSTNEDTGETPLDQDRSGPINSLTVFPKLLTERGDETAEEFIMLTETEQMLSTRPAEVDQLNGKSACSSAADSVSSSEVNSSFKKIRLSLLQAIAGLRKKPHSPRYSVSPNPKLTRLGDMDLNFNQVLKATQNFSPSMQIGKGTFGIVYRGQLEGGQVVAIKRAKRDHFKDLRNEFGQNVELLVKIDHQNLVKLLGFIDKGNECLIVTEYVPNGTLKAHLDGHRDTILDFNRRLGIAIDVAHGLTYLHVYSEKQIIHRDVKSSNILLTDSMRAKVADFGFAMLGAEDSVPTHVSTSVKGTVGYLDPEYMRTLRLTAESDVYSFGILLLEILTGRRPVEPNRPNDERVTLRWAFKKLEEGSVLDLVDPRMEEVVDGQMLVRFVELAIRCAAPVRSDRPDMKSVGEQLGGIRAEYYKRLKRGSQA